MNIGAMCALAAAVTNVYFALLAAMIPGLGSPAFSDTTQAISVSRSLPALVLQRSDSQTASFSLPQRTSLVAARLVVDVTFRGDIQPQSTMTVLVNGVRRGVITRASAAPGGEASNVIELARRDLSGSSIAITFIAALASHADRCADDDDPHGVVRIARTSHIELRGAPRSSSERDAIIAFGDTVPLKRNPLVTESELDALITATVRLGRNGQVAAFSETGLSPAAITTALGVTPRIIDLNPDIRQLGVSPLRRDFSRRTLWRIPLDQRRMPSARVPERLVLKMVSASNGADRLLRVRVLLNGHLLRKVDVLGDGSRRTIRLFFPEEAVGVYNEVTLTAERDTPDWGNCNARATTYPAQIQDDSYLHLAEARPRARTIPELVASLPDTFDLYLPRSERARPDHIIGTFAAVSRALWGDTHHTRTHFYDDSATVHLHKSGVVLTPTNAPRSRIALTDAFGAQALHLTLAANGTLPAEPEYYGAADTVSFAVTGASSVRAAKATDAGEVDPLTFVVKRALWVVGGVLFLPLAGVARERYRTYTTKP